MSAASPTPAERALAAVIYAPIGLGAAVVDELPGAVTKARQQLVFARFIGKMAVDRGVRDLRDRLDRLTTVQSSPDTSTVPPSSDVKPTIEPFGSIVQTEGAVMSTAKDGVTDAEAAVTTPTKPPGSDTLALPDYDQLPAAHIVGKLDGLTPAELDAIEAHETAHRHRRTVLGKIRQLRGG